MLANKAGLYIVDPDRKGAASSKPKDAKDNESQKAYYTRKYMEIHAALTKKKGQPRSGWPKLKKWSYSRIRKLTGRKLSIRY